MSPRVLIANRGEIACRIMRTCRALGIRTVAVHSEADADARHVREADEAVAIGPAPAAESYLSIEAVLAAARATGAEAVHPGHGFPSENRAFAPALEEAPSALIDPRTRAAMGEQAVALARAVGYRSAGTVEFIVDAAKSFYFLEMNTRLQVEHPVTEMVTGLDLVEWMIRIAAGEKLPLRQQDVGFDGWAIEARIYAEDPKRGFLPSTGRLVRYREPPASPSVRVDSGVFEGAEITVYYDPMIAKLIAHGSNRAAAVASLAEALDGFVIAGVAHNIPALAALLAHPRFAAGDLSTDFIAEHFPDGLARRPPGEGQPAPLVALAAGIPHRLW